MVQHCLFRWWVGDVSGFPHAEHSFNNPQKCGAKPSDTTLAFKRCPMKSKRRSKLTPEQKKQRRDPDSLYWQKRKKTDKYWNMIEGYAGLWTTDSPCLACKKNKSVKGIHYCKACRFKFT